MRGQERLKSKMLTFFLWFLVIGYVINIIKAFAGMAQGERTVTVVVVVKPSDHKIPLFVSTFMLLWVAYLIGSGSTC